MLKNSLTILFALFTLLPAQSERSVIAITDVSAEGLSNIEIKMFYNWLESELVNLGQYDVTSRQEVDKILKEQKFQQLSGCTDQQCAAEIGRMLNADLMLLPSILYDSRSGVVSVSLKLVDVETARITTAITKDADVQRAIDVNVFIRDYLVDLYRRDSEEKGIIVTPTPAEKVVGKGRLIIKSIQIGDQLWMAENLKVEHYRDGTAIPTGYSDSEWGNLSTGAYAVYDNNETHADTYGYLYNWYAVNDSRNIAPEGWHVPTDDEWQTLVDYLGGSSVAGGKLKEAGTEHWNSPNTGATNESGFTALPGGCRDDGGGYDGMGYYGYFWSSMGSSSSYTWGRELGYDFSDVFRDYYCKQDGFSIRCLRD